MKNVLTWAITMLLSFVLCGAWAADVEPTISVSAKQRYPWNGLADVKFTITGEASKKYATSFIAKDLVGNTNITMKTIYKSKDVLAKSLEDLAPGSYSWIWDVSKDLPKDWESASVSVVGEAKYVDPLYIVIDLSAGKDAISYPIEYIYETPSGGWTDEYKTTKLVMRRIEPGTFIMDGMHKVTLSKAYYIGVYEVTQKQYELVKGETPSGFKGDMRPVERVSWDIIRGASSVYNWPNVKTLDSDSFMGRLQTRTFLGFDLPTEAQWEYACRAGTTTVFSYADTASGLYMWYNQNSEFKTHDVGMRLSNPWGLFDMHGNVLEWCLDWYGNLSGESINPEGASYGEGRVFRGGGWGDAWEGCSSSYRRNTLSTLVNDGYGFRLAIHLVE